MTSTTIKTGNIARIKKIPSRSFCSHGHMPPAKTKILLTSRPPHGHNHTHKGVVTPHFRQKQYKKTALSLPGIILPLDPWLEGALLDRTGPLI